jgi:hypothetical protein
MVLQILIGRKGDAQSLGIDLLLLKPQRSSTINLARKLRRNIADLDPENPRKRRLSTMILVKKFMRLNLKNIWQINKRRLQMIKENRLRYPIPSTSGQKDQALLLN